jgi:hypothetical protein
MVFTLTEANNVHFRMARLPTGPTLTFRVERYSLMKLVSKIKCLQVRWTPIDVDCGKLGIL